MRLTGTDYLDRQQEEHRNQMRPMEQEVLYIRKREQCHEYSWNIATMKARRMRLTQQGLEQGPRQRNRASCFRRFVEGHWIRRRGLLQFLATTF